MGWSCCAAAAAVAAAVAAGAAGVLAAEGGERSKGHEVRGRGRPQPMAPCNADRGSVGQRPRQAKIHVVARRRRLHKGQTVAVRAAKNRDKLF